MKNEKGLKQHPCSECGGVLERQSISRGFEREGTKIRLSALKAWVCKGCGEIYFLPGGAGKVVKAANSLFELALTEEQHKGTLTAHI